MTGAGRNLRPAPRPAARRRPSAREASRRLHPAARRADSAGSETTAWHTRSVSASQRMLRRDGYWPASAPAGRHQRSGRTSVVSEPRGRPVPGAFLLGQDNADPATVAVLCARRSRPSRPCGSRRAPLPADADRQLVRIRIFALPQFAVPGPTTSWFLCARRGRSAAPDSLAYSQPRAARSASDALCELRRSALGRDRWGLSRLARDSNDHHDRLALPAAAAGAWVSEARLGHHYESWKVSCRWSAPWRARPGARHRGLRDQGLSTGKADSVPEAYSEGRPGFPACNVLFSRRLLLTLGAR
jgi:hypothetical protein